MSAKMVLMLAVVVALAVGAEASGLREHCRRVSKMMAFEPESWTDSAVAYKIAMKHIKSFGNAFNRELRTLAAAWRAVAFDERCSSKSLAYVHAIYACEPSANANQKRLEDDAHKYAQKCLTNDYLEEKVRKYAGANSNGLLTSELFAEYRRVNPSEAPLQFYDKPRQCACCRPLRASKVLVEAVQRDFPQEAERLHAQGELSSKLVGKFLERHLYKPCVSYVQRVTKLMDELEVAAYYTKNEDLRGLPQDVKDAIFRYRMCQNLQSEANKYDLERMMAREF